MSGKKVLVTLGGVGCLGCGGLIAVCVTMLWLTGAISYGRGGPFDAVRDELADLRAGRRQQAYDRLEPRYRESLSRKAFDDLVDEHPILLTHTESNFPDHRIDVINGTSTFRGVVSAQGKDQYVFIHLVQVPARGWMIDQLSFPDHWED